MRYVFSFKFTLSIFFLAFSANTHSQTKERPIENFEEFLFTLEKYNNAAEAYQSGGPQAFIGALSNDLKIYDTLDLNKILKKEMKIPKLMFSETDILFVFNENNIFRSPTHPATKGILSIKGKQLVYNFKYSILFNFINFKKVAPEHSNVLLAFSTFCSLYERVMSSTSTPVFADSTVAPTRNIASIPQKSIPSDKSLSSLDVPTPLSLTSAPKDDILDNPEFADLFDNSKPENAVLWIPAVFKLRGKQRKEFLEILFMASDPIESHTIGNLIKNYYKKSSREKLRKNFERIISKTNPYKSKYLHTLDKALGQSELFLITPRFKHEYSNNNFRPSWVFALTRQGVTNLNDFQNKYNSEEKIIALANNILNKDKKILISYTFSPQNKKPQAKKMQFLSAQKIAQAFAVSYNKMP